MGAWADMAINQIDLRGVTSVDEALWSLVDTMRVSAAKRLVVTLTRARLRDQILLYDGEVAFYDAVADSTDLVEVRKEIVVYAYLYLTYLDLANRPGRGQGAVQKAAEYYNPNAQPRPTGLLIEALHGFVGIAAAILQVEDGTDAEDVQGRATYSEVISVTSNWG